MSLIVNSVEADRLAHEIASATGESVERVVVDALRKRHAELPQAPAPEASKEELMAMLQAVWPRVKGPYEDHGTLLYDEHGLPK